MRLRRSGSTREFGKVSLRISQAKALVRFSRYPVAFDRMRTIGFLAFLMIAASCAADVPQVVRENLKRESFDTFHFVPDGVPRAIVLFGSGDGGWGYLENKICMFLKANSFYVVGIDCRRYAESDYDNATLVSDFATIANDALRRGGHPELQVVYGGWSMGAIQAVAATARGRRSLSLVGLLLMSMDKRGRYGLRLTDEIGLAPRGNDTFGVADFTSWVTNLRVVQYEAVGDWMSDVDWIQTLQTSHRLYRLQHSNHDFNGANEELRKKVLEGLNWILDRFFPTADRREQS